MKSSHNRLFRRRVSGWRSLLAHARFRSMRQAPSSCGRMVPSPLPGVRWKMIRGAYAAKAREPLEQTAQERRDPTLTVADGRRIFGSEDADLPVGNLHPGPRGIDLIAHRVTAMLQDAAPRIGQARDTMLRRRPSNGLSTCFPSMACRHCILASPTTNHGECRSKGFERIDSFSTLASMPCANWPPEPMSISAVMKCSACRTSPIAQ